MSKLRKPIKFLLALAVFPLMLYLSFYSLNQQGFFKIQKIELQVGTTESQRNYISPKVSELQEKLNQYRGIPLWEAPLSEISKILKEESWIKEFQLSREWPAGISVSITADDIAILVMPKSSSESSIGEVSHLKPITKSGKVLDKINSKLAPNAIVSFDSQFLADQKIREGGLEVVKSLPTSGRMAAAYVSEIGYDRKEGYWIKLLNSDTKVNFGEEQFEIKSARISQVIEYLEGRNLKARVIDANLSKKVLVRLQQSP